MEQISAFAAYNHSNKKNKNSVKKVKNIKNKLKQNIQEKIQKTPKDLIEINSHVKLKKANKKHSIGQNNSPQQYNNKEEISSAFDTKKIKSSTLKAKKRLQKDSTPKKTTIKENVKQSKKVTNSSFSKSFSESESIENFTESSIIDKRTAPQLVGKNDFDLSAQHTTGRQRKLKPLQSARTKSEQHSSVISNFPSASTNDSIQNGMNVLKYLLAPIELNQFFENCWEKEPLLIQRNDPKYFGNLISFKAIDDMLLRNHVEFTKNIDVTSYKNGVRETLNPEGRALPGIVWDMYDEGCSIRLLNPQTFLPAIYAMNTSLQEYFHCMVGANVYLTPPASQGFAPHYDDIEAFVLQIEGEKRWKLYNPRNKEEVLPRLSSENFAQNDIGKPILEKVLRPGDILYFPRGTIHQAKTEGDSHSLHITLSMYQKQSYADLFEILMPMMLSRAIKENIELRRGLPLNIWYNLGRVHSDSRSKDRQEIVKKCHDLLDKVLSNIPLDDAVDQMAKKYQHDALPPEIASNEKNHTMYGVKTVLNEKGRPHDNLDDNLNNGTSIRLLRANILRMVEEDDKVNIYYYADNSREYHEYEPNYLEIESEDAHAIEFLIKCYPEYVLVKNLPIDDEDHRFMVIRDLFNRGLLMMENPLKEV